MDLCKYEDSIIRNLDSDNMAKIIYFLESKNIDYVSDIINDYLDIFMFDCEEFIDRFNKLSDKYDNFIYLLNKDLGILENLYYV